MQRRAAVTGGAGGIGSAIVRALTETGHEVAILDREGDFAVDLADDGAVREIAGRLGPREVLVHAAAAFDRATLAGLDAATWRRVQAVNVESALWLCRGQQGDAGGRRPRTREAARRPRNHRQLRGAGFDRTPFTEADLPEEAFAEVRARQVLPRTLVPDDAAAMVAFLASDAAAAVSGQTLCTDGGSVLR